MAGEGRVSRSLECDGVRAALELHLEDQRAKLEIDAGASDARSGEFAWRIGQGGEIRVTLEGRSLLVTLFRTRDALWLHADGRSWCFRPATTSRSRTKAASAAEGPELRAPMTGTVRRIAVAVGDRVQRGTPLLALEAMKMEHLLRAPRDLTIESVHCREGETVDLGAVLLLFVDEGAAPSRREEQDS